MEFKSRADVISTILKEALKDKDRVFGREINELEERYRKLSGYSWMGSDVYLVARASKEYVVTKLYELLGFDKKVNPTVRKIVSRAARLYFNRQVLFHENIIYKSFSQQLEEDMKGLKEKVENLAGIEIEDFGTKVSQLEELLTE